MRRPPLNGKAVLWRCQTHRDVTVTLYGLSSAAAWCFCGREMRRGRSTAQGTRKKKR